MQTERPSSTGRRSDSKKPRMERTRHSYRIPRKRNELLVWEVERHNEGIHLSSKNLRGWKRPFSEQEAMGRHIHGSDKHGSLVDAHALIELHGDRFTP